MEDARKWDGGVVRRMVKTAGGTVGARAIGKLVFCKAIPASAIGIMIVFDSRIHDALVWGR